MKGRETGGRREKGLTPFNFNIVTFGEKKNARLGRDFSSLAPFSCI